MAEEHRCQPQQLCVNNCGFFGSPTTQNLCSKCYGDLHLEEQQSTSAKQVFNQTLIPSFSSSSISLAVKHEPLVESTMEKPVQSEVVPVQVHHVQVRPNRCLACKKRVGITGFKCRCGMVFCGTHRYPEKHACSFDFKGMGKRQIAEANPVIKAEKLRKI